MFDDPGSRRRGRLALRAATVVTAVAPALLDQPTTDTSGTAWLALGGYVVVAAVAIALGPRWPLGTFVATLVTLGAAEVVAAAAEAKISPMAVLPLAFGLYALGAYSRPRRAVLAMVGGAAVVLFGVCLLYI
ncbi:hypothetical protein E1283_22155, partial [Streptomyces hainanensis]